MASREGNGTGNGNGSGHGRPFMGGGVNGHIRAYSSGSRGSVAPMPVIDEDEVSKTPPKSPTRPMSSYPRAPVTVLPLRVPQRTHPRRSMQNVPPPPYFPITHLGNLSPGKEMPPPPAFTDSEGTGRQSSEGSWPQKPGPPTTSRWPLADRQWFGSRRSRWLQFIGLIVLGMGLIAALAVGLTVGLRNSGGSGNDDSSNGTEPPPPVFPAGSFAFETTLQKTEAACASDSAAWRCYPDTQGANATFFWFVNEDSDDASSYTVSSTDNPFAPTFSNISATVLDKDSDDERLVFSFDMDKTVAAGEALTSDNRAARCSFPGTKFEATMWTRRRNGETVSAPDSSSSDGSQFPAWPGDVDIVQSNGPTPDSPQCEDVDGNAITEVQPGDGDCTCDYANF